VKISPLAGGEFSKIYSFGALLFFSFGKNLSAPFLKDILREILLKTFTYRGNIRVFPPLLVQDEHISRLKIFDFPPIFIRVVPC